MINFRQHEKLVIPITGNLIGVVGPNGSGKSNLFNGIQYTLVGDVPGVVKEKLLRWGASSGYSKLILDEGVTIKRDLVTSSAEMVGKTGGRIHGTIAVNNAVKAMYGLDKELSRQAIFARQAEIDSVLFETASKREQAFQKLCGMGQASTIHRQMGEIISAKFKEPPNYDDQLAVAKQKLVADEARLANLNNSIPTIPDGNAIIRLKTLFTAGSALLPKISRLDSLGTEVAEYKNELLTLSIELTRLEADKSVLDIEDLDVQISGARQFLIEVQAYHTAKENLIKARNSTVIQPPETNEAKLESMTAQYAIANQRWIAAKANYASLKSIFDAISGSDISVCPVCHSHIAEPELVKDELKSKLTELTGLTASDKDPKRLNEAIIEARHSIDKYNKSVSSARALMDSAQHEFEKFKEPMDIDPKAILAEIAVLENTKRIAQQNKDTMVTVLSRRKTIEETTAKKQMEYDKLADDISKQASDFWQYNIGSQELKSAILNDVSAAEKAIDEITKAAYERSRIMGNIEELAKSLNVLKTSIAELEKKREAASGFTSVLKTLTMARDWFHYSNGPRTLSASIVNDMTADINSFLDKLEAPFSVVPNTVNGLAFQCLFHDGRASGVNKLPDAEDLSGGQKILLATAFRLASYCMFANQLGMLSLDEPTVYLDDKNITRFCGFLEKVKEVATALNLQIFIATHERSVIPYMDTVIDLT